MGPEAGGPEPEFREITLADIVRVLHRRKLVLAVVVVACVAAGAAVTAMTTPEYESRATLIPLEHPDIIKNWLDSRLAGEMVAEDLGTRLLPTLFAGRWDADAQRWIGDAPSREEAGAAVSAHVDVSVAASTRGNERLITVTATMTDPLLARDVADAYVRTLDALRPHLENITRQAAFDKYYDGQNEQQAQARAEVTARQMDYWLLLDSANTPQEPSKPKPVLNLALATVLGLFLGVFTVFFLEWLDNYRAEQRRVDVPAEPSAPPAPPPREPTVARRRFE